MKQCVKCQFNYKNIKYAELRRKRKFCYLFNEYVENCEYRIELTF